MLFAIENMTARQVDLSKRATAWYATARSQEDRQSQFLEALAEGREATVQPEVQDIERYAANWASLVGDADANLRTALAHAAGAKYAFPPEAVPGIRAAVGLDTEPVRGAFHRLYGESLDAILVTCKTDIRISRSPSVSSPVCWKPMPL